MRFTQRRTVLPPLFALFAGSLTGCAGLGPSAAERATPKFVVVVKFESDLSDEEIRRRYPTRMPEFRTLPGLVQKYYLKDARAKEWAGIYLWDSMESVEAYMKSDLKASIPEAYGVVGQPRVELFELVDALR